MTYTKKMTEGSELKHIILFTLPLFAGNVFQQLYNIVDSIIVGKFLGSDKLAAVGTTGSLTYLFSTLCIGLSVGAGILISQRFGAGMHKEVKKLITNSAYVILAFGAVVTVISVALAGLLMKMMNTPENLLQDATSYMRAACSGTICVAAYNWINAVMRSLGDSRTPLIFLVVASLLNVGLDLLFVVVFGWGVVGAAYATVISQGISAAGSIIVGFRRNPYFRLTREDAKPVGEVCRKCITTGIPIALQNAMISVSMIFLQRTANGFGETVMAALYCGHPAGEYRPHPCVRLERGYGHLCWAEYRRRASEARYPRISQEYAGDRGIRPVHYGDIPAAWRPDRGNVRGRSAGNRDRRKGSSAVLPVLHRAGNYPHHARTS